VPKHYRSLEDVSLQNSWLTIGVFDGVHRGNQESIKNLTAGAHANGAPAVVLTFWPHPAVVLHKRENVRCLTTPDERATLMMDLGVDAVITHPFSTGLASLSALEFMRFVNRHLNLHSLWIGYDFALGHDREGDFAHLTEIGKELGYGTQAIDAVKNGGAIVSSSMLRRQIQNGEVTAAAESLGRNYALSGPVIHGDGRGRKINIPTANIDYSPDKIIPAFGVYATWAWVEGKRYRAATNIGVNPTFTPDKVTPNVEAHLLDFDRDLYGQEMTLEFVARLRNERTCQSVDALLEQIHADIDETRRVLI